MVDEGAADKVKGMGLANQLMMGGGALLFISSFLPWFKVDFGDSLGFGPSSVSGNGWDTGFFWGGIPALLGLAIAVVIGLRVFSPDTTLPELPVPLHQAIMGAAGLAAAIVVLKLLVGESPSEIVKRTWGLFIAVIAAIALAVGAFQNFQAENKSSAS